MRVGVPREVKDQEYRVGMTPAGVDALSKAGHEVLLETGAGEGSGIPDEEYVAAGAEIAGSAADVWGRSEMVVKVKEPISSEYDLIQEGQTLFTYLHLAPLPDLTDVLLRKSVTGIAYETVTGADGRSLPLLTPMSEIAGRMATLVGAFYQQRPFGGRGTLLSGVPGVPPSDVVILGGGIVGLNSARMALGLGARVTILEASAERMRFLDNLFLGAVTTVANNPLNLLSALSRADVLIGAVLIPGHSAPKLVTQADLLEMKPRSVVVDVSVDQGGCFETTHPTTHSDPIYEVEGVVHYCVANMPGAVPRTSTFALNNVTLPYTLALAEQGPVAAAQADPGLQGGFNTFRGHITSQAVAHSQDRAYHPFSDLL